MEKMMVDDYLLMGYELMALVVVVVQASNGKEELEQDWGMGFYSLSNSDEIYQLQIYILLIVNRVYDE
jgi:hypothetical protein